MNSAIDRLEIMDDLWRLLFRIDRKKPKTRKDFKTTTCTVLKTLTELTDHPTLKIGVFNKIKKNFYYWPHSYIRGKTGLPNWRYFKAIDFLEKSKILFLEKKNIHDESTKIISSRLFKTLKFLLFLAS